MIMNNFMFSFVVEFFDDKMIEYSLINILIIVTSIFDRVYTFYRIDILGMILKTVSYKDEV